MKDYIKKNPSYLIALMFLSLVISIGVFSVIGSANIGPLDVSRIILAKLPFISKYIDLDHIPMAHQSIIWSVRLPRVLLGVLVGSSLSIAGGVFQGLFRNPMADPYIIGVSSGAALGAALGIVFGININILGIPSISILAFIGAILTVFIVYSISRSNNFISTSNLLLAGVAVGQFFTAINSILMVLSSKDMERIMFWTMGNLGGKGWDPIVRLSLPIILAMILIVFHGRDLNLILSGEENAKSMGLDLEKTKIKLIVLSSIITALVVSVSGIIGFVGLIIPHISRLIFGPDNRLILPVSAILGGIFLAFTDTIARTVMSPLEIPVGIITAIFGAPFFIYLLKTRNK